MELPSQTVVSSLSYWLPLMKLPLAPSFFADLIVLTQSKILLPNQSCLSLSTFIFLIMESPLRPSPDLPLPFGLFGNKESKFSAHIMIGQHFMTNCTVSLSLAETSQLSLRCWLLYILYDWAQVSFPSQSSLCYIGLKFAKFLEFFLEGTLCIPPYCTEEWPCTQI